MPQPVKPRATAAAAGWASAPATEEGPLRFVLLAAVCATIAAFLVNEVYDLDVWWHVTIGRDILATLHVPATDRYSAAGLGRPYHDSHWLFQVVLALLDAPWGLAGAQLVTVVMWGAIAAVTWRACRFWAGSVVATWLLFLAAMASVERFLPRPELVTFLGLVLFYDLLQRRAFRSAAGLAALTLIQAAWTNSHGLFVVGPFLVGCYWLGEAAGRLRGGGGDLGAVSRALALVLAATLVAPFGLDGWRYAALLFSEVGSGAPPILAHLNELSPTFGPAFRAAPAFWFFAALLALGALSLVAALRAGRVSPRLLIAAGMLAAALTGRRNVVLFALVAAPLAAEHLGPLVDAARRLPRAAVAATAVLIAAWASYPLSGAYYLKMEIPSRFGLGVTPSFFPHGLPAFLDTLGFRGQVLNSNTLGGFYAYHGYPRRLPLTDGRWEVYDTQRLGFIFSTATRGGDWQRLLSEYKIEGLLLAHSSPEAALAAVRSRDPAWRLVYLDAAASFWLPADSAAAAPAVDLNDSASLPEIRRPDDGLILDEFLARVRADGLRLEVLRRTARFGQRLGVVLSRLGGLEMALGRRDDARRTFEALLRAEPRHTGALNELAFLAYARGDLDGAKGYLERALALEPDNASCRENLARVSAALARRAPGAVGSRP